MLSEKSLLILQAHKLLDICVAAGAFIGAYFIKKDFLPEPFRGLISGPTYYLVLLLIIIIRYPTFSFFDAYAPCKNQNLGEIFWKNDASFEEWINIDLEYIDNWSLGLDFKI
jgi:hypothetical protein